MNNNNLDQISMQSSVRKIARFNFKHSVDTSMSIGEIQVTQCDEMQPDSRYVQSVTSVVRLDPMVAPTFGELNLHHNFFFVGLSELYPKFAAFLAEKPVQFGLNTYVPSELPFVPLRLLCALCFVGSKITAYTLSGYETSPSRGSELYSYDYSALADVVSDIGVPATTISESGRIFWSKLNDLASNDDPANGRLWRPAGTYTKGGVTFGSTIWKGYDGAYLNVGRLFGFVNDDLWVPTANWSTSSFFEFVGDDAIKRSPNYVEGMTDLDTISLDADGNNDVILMTSLPYDNEGQVANVGCCFAVRFSDFGKRLWKLLIGMGYGYDGNSNESVSLSKFFASYMAWFNGFAPELYQGWETTNCAKLCAAFDANNFKDYGLFCNSTFDSLSSDEVDICSAFFGFLVDILSMWHSEEQDFITAHIRGASVASAKNGFISKLNESGANVNGVTNVTPNMDTSAEPQTPQGETIARQQGHAYINNVLHTQMDSEVLKRLYKIVNRETIAGRRIKQLLEAQGLGDYVKRCKSSFVGHDKVKIDIFDVTSTSDTLERATGKGMYLGEYVGKGVGDGKSKRFKFRSDEIGYFIELSSVVPESGWTNGIDPATRHVKPHDFYHPDADGLGMEASKKNIFIGVNYCIRPKDNANPLVQTFGYIPTESSHKYTRDVMNGNFSLNSVKKAYTPYTFNKIVDVGQRRCKLRSISSTTKTFDIYKLFDASKIPLASPMLRFIGRYAWMGRFLRIFADLGRDAAASYPAYYDFNTLSAESSRWFYCANSIDPFLVHNVYLTDYYAHMLPLEESFGTHEDNNNGYTNMLIGKA